MKSILLLFLVLIETYFAQQDPVADVFPLAIGNKWTYEFWTTDVVSHTGTHDNGIIEFTIIASIPLTDSTRWQFFQRRNFTHTIIFHGGTNFYSIQDSNSFEIIEFNCGNHELYTPVYDPLSAFPFQKLLVDTSSRFFRYMVVDTNGNSALSLSFPNVNDPTLSYSCSFTLRKDTGIVQTSAFQNTDHQIGFLATGYTLQYFYSNQSQTNVLSSTNILPTKMILFQNYPNPFNPTTKIRYTIPSVGTSVMKFVQLKIYDVLGNEVATLVNEEKPAGSYELTWNAGNLSSDIYFYRIQTRNFIETKKMLLLR